MKKDFDLKTLVRGNIKNLRPYTSARDEFQGDSNNMIFLDANENPFNSEVNRYPDPYQNKVKDILATQKGIDKSQILIGNGSDEVLDLIFRVFCEPNKDNIITLPPTYGMYEVLANTNAIEVLKVELDTNFQIDTSKILQTINEQTKLIFICSPNNPTANDIDVSKIETLLNSFNGILVIDEAYIDFSENKSWLTRLNEYPNLIVTQTLSKAYGVAGIRLGICYASEEIISYLNKIKPPYNVNVLSQEKAVLQLNNQDVEKQIKTLIEQRKQLMLKLKEVPFVERIYNSSTNFILLKVDDANKRYTQLINKGIVVRNRSNQPLCDNCLRITVGTEKENNTLINVLNKLQ